MATTQTKITAVSDECLKLIQHYEGLFLDAYKDPVGIWTIGIGTIRYPNGAPVKKGDKITQIQAWDFLWHDLTQFMKDVDYYTTDKITQGQFDALVSFTYNVGAGNFKTSTLLKKLNKNPSDATISAEFEKWKYAKGVELAGLLKRRKAEAHLYKTGTFKIF